MLSMHSNMCFATLLRNLHCLFFTYKANSKFFSQLALHDLPPSTSIYHPMSYFLWFSTCRPIFPGQFTTPLTCPLLSHVFHYSSSGIFALCVPPPRFSLIDLLPILPRPQGKACSFVKNYESFPAGRNFFTMYMLVVIDLLLQFFLQI
jgi:hypothetical protein